MTRYLVAASLLAFVASPALAAEFWIAQYPPDKECNIVETKPDGQTVVMVGTSSYATKAEAKEARKSFPDCAKD